MPAEAVDVGERLAVLRARSPQKFGYLSSNWREAKTGLDNTDSTFARAADIRANITDSGVDTRTLGYTLQILAELDVLEPGPERNAATLYDLRSYDADLMATIGRELDTS